MAGFENVRWLLGVAILLKPEMDNPAFEFHMNIQVLSTKRYCVFRKLFSAP